MLTVESTSKSWNFFAILQLQKAVATVDDSPKGTFPGHVFSLLDDAILAQVIVVLSYANNHE